MSISTVSKALNSLPEEDVYVNVSESRAFTHALFIYLAFLFAVAFVLFLLTLCFIVAVYTLHGVNLNLKIRFLGGTLLFCMRRSNEN